MDITQTIKELQNESAHKVSHAVGDLNAPWKKVERNRRTRRLKRGVVISGFLLGLAAVAGVLVYAILNESWRLSSD
jgi:hypothetical protein